MLAICFPKYQFAMEYNKVLVKATSGWRRNPRMVDIGDCARAGQVEGDDPETKAMKVDSFFWWLEERDRTEAHDRFIEAVLPWRNADYRWPILLTAGQDEPE